MTTPRPGAAAATALALLLGPTGCSPSAPPAPTASPSQTGAASPTPTPAAPPTPTHQPSPAPSPSPSPAPSSSPSPAPSPSPSSIPADLLGVDVERLATSADVVALTFDGGSGDAGVASILSTLESRGVRATFFFTGEFARRFPGDVAAIVAAGHRIGNHSDTHAHYPQLLDVEITADLARAEASIVAAGSSAGKPLFRFPFGDRTAADIRAVNNAGYLPVRWTVDTLGWKGTSGGITAAVVVQRVLDTAAPGQIVLMHLGANPTDGSTLDADALPQIIDELRTRGYTFVTLDSLLD